MITLISLTTIGLVSFGIVISLVWALQAAKRLTPSDTSWT